MFRNIKIKNCLTAVLSSAFLAFGLYHVHSCSGVTEGGILGMALLLQHQLGWSPAVTGFAMNLACYLLGFKLLGREFVIYSAVSAAGFSISYKIFEQFPLLWPQLYEMPLLAALLGAVFVGVGAGVCIRMGGAPSGDDALAMSCAQLFHVRIQWVYLVSDLLVLVLSLCYIPVNRIGYSLLTVILSGQLLGWIQKKESV